MIVLRVGDETYYYVAAYHQGGRARVRDCPHRHPSPRLAAQCLATQPHDGHRYLVRAVGRDGERPLNLAESEDVWVERQKGRW